MSEFADACRELAALADRASSFPFEPTPGNTSQAEENAGVLMGAMVGRGFQVNRPFPLPDNGTEKILIGALSLRVVHVATQGRLLIETELHWKTSAGTKHGSYVRYLIPLERAEELGGLPPLAHNTTEGGTDFDSIKRQADASTARCELFGATWHQTYPGSLDQWGTGVDVAELDRLSEVHGTYHLLTVQGAHETEPRLTALLDGGDTPSAPKPEAVVAIAAWLRDYPEAVDEALA